MVPKFPNFKALELADQNEIIRKTSKFLPYSDFNFTSLFSYNIKDDVMLSILNDNLIMRFRDYITGDPFYTYIGKNKPANTIKNLLNLSKKEKITPILKLIPWDNIKNEFKLLNSDYKIKADRDNFDYILSTESLSTLSGQKFEHERWRVNKFTKNYQYDAYTFNFENTRLKNELLELFKHWANFKNKNDEDTKHELIALTKLLDHAKSFNLLGLGIYVDKKLIGFCINEILNKDYAIGHFMKSNHEFSGTTEMLFNLAARSLAEKDIKYINAEQDLGIQGLRKSKEEWNPVTFLKKYTISLKD